MRDARLVDTVQDAPDPARRRKAVRVTGTVQGVGFRPFVYLTAGALGLGGWVRNESGSVYIEVEGPPARIEAFIEALRHNPPPLAVVREVTVWDLPCRGETAFAIQDSLAGASLSPVVPAETATCQACLEEIRDPRQRRFRYPFTNCTRCGPRYSIIEALPYDRTRTAMKAFPLCDQCRQEYHDPRDRRFHAEPIACPRCGPRLEMWDPAGACVATGDEALRRAAEAIREGAIVALKGLGGFQLLVDARSEEAVRRLRERKRREAKPFALMFPGPEVVKAVCRVSPEEEQLLSSPQAPIVLLLRRPPDPGREESLPGEAIAACVAPGNPYLGVMLPYTPLHHLLMQELGFPVVCTSGNLSEEPICIDNAEAVRRLKGIADLFLVHDRPILRHVDDSVASVMAGRPVLWRRARGYAPLPVSVGRPLPAILAVGGHLKNTVALAVGSEVVVSQHIGDLENAEAVAAFERVVADLLGFFRLEVERVACDLHPDYFSSRFAEQFSRERGVPLVRVQHHHAHVAACMAEHGLRGPVLGVAWDGTGYGTDGTVWGGEFLVVDEGGFRRVAHMRPFRLPGGDKAVREPRRSALGVLFELEKAGPIPCSDTVARNLGFSEAEVRVLETMLRRGLNAPVTTSAGRLFDALSALLGLRTRSSFEGQAAMELEFAIERRGYTEAAAVSGLTEEAYPLPLVRPGAGEGGCWVADWEPALRGVIQDMQRGVPAGRISLRFHNALVALMVAVAREVGLEQVVLSGGCFQNRYLTERAVSRLHQAGFSVYTHQTVPPNDGGISLGQVLVAAGWQASKEVDGHVPGDPG
ncbi:MAG: carbamoyltransferase HypF [Bacillota bacterium]